MKNMPVAMPSIKTRNDFSNAIGSPVCGICKRSEPIAVFRTLPLFAGIIAVLAFLVSPLCGSAKAGTIANRVLGQPDLYHNSANTVDP
jgi:hypothetical protein